MDPCIGGFGNKIVMNGAACCNQPIHVNPPVAHCTI